MDVVWGKPFKMGKRQHQKDKMYLTYTEWTTFYGGKKAGPETSNFRRLPFDHCCMCLQPFEHPYCDKQGNIFELQAIVDFLKKFKINPVTGEPLDAKNLIKLNFHKNAKGDYHCPVLYKPFTKQSHIVAVATTGNVFSYEDPNHLEKFNLSEFHHIKNNLRVVEEVDKDPAANLKTVSMETREILEELKREYKPPEVKEEDKKVADKFNAAHYSTGAVAAGFTSTVIAPETKHEAAIIEEDLVRYERVKKKGYVRLVTTFGPLNLELYCDIQGGDPTGTGEGGESIWGKPFEDEFKPNLTHTGRGLDTLTAMEKVETDNKDRPIEDIIIEKAQVFVDPYQEADEQVELCTLSPFYLHVWIVK
ncbi:Peptidyl-prolyl cis-trans isomerase-like 2 [Blattella germanica]|nr:Peptidyl-prolyl cis-trans isomerase-like 2 [Blattella germanica]